MSENGGEKRRVRKDPHAERAGGRKRIDRAAEADAPAPPAAAPGGRVRKDPHAERGGAQATGGRKRIDRGAEAAPAQPAPSGRTRRDPRADRQARRSGEAVSTGRAGAVAEPATPTAPVRRIDDPTCLILVAPDLEDGRLTSHDRDTLGAARLVADALGGAVVAIVFVPEAGPHEDLDLAAAGADRLILMRHAAFDRYAPEARAAAMLAALQRLEARHVLLPDDPVGGGDVGRRIAARLGDRAAANVQRIAADAVTRRGGGGKSDFVMAPPRVLLIANEAADPVMDERFEARALDAPEPTTDVLIEDGGLAETDPSAVALAEADFIASAGNGITDWDAFHAVATALGASEGGSRVVCDAGLLPKSRQVGASGTLVEPRCYIAFGIAGAPQHLQGIQRCERVVAVNTDLYADMIKRADLSVILDAQRVMPALTKLMEEKRRGA